MTVVRVPKGDAQEIQGKNKNELAAMPPAEFRDMVRQGKWTDVNIRGVCHGYVFANLAIVPKEYAFEFLLLCNRNPRACPVLDVTEPGDPHPKLLAPNADIRTDVPKYRVYQNGTLIDEPTDIIKYWRNDLVAFLIGCSQNFDFVLRSANIKYRSLGVYSTTMALIPAGQFHGNMAVSGRLFKTSYDAVRAVQISSRYPAAHGYPVHIGNPVDIGIADLNQPDITTYDEAPQEQGEIPMFWGCGNTPQLVAIASKTPFFISHCQAHMFIGDRRCEELAAF